MDSVQHPYGFLCFFIILILEMLLSFVQRIILTAHGCEYIAVFSVHEFFALVQFCENEAHDFVKFVYL